LTYKFGGEFRIYSSNTVRGDVANGVAWAACPFLYYPPANGPAINTLFLVLRGWGGWCRLVTNYPGI